jgi:protein SCO1/2
MTDSDDGGRPKGRYRNLIVAGLALAFIAGTGWYQLRHFAGGTNGGHEALPNPPTADIGGPFTLTDQDGNRVSDTDFRGKFMLVFFGYTFCPDVCPTELTTITDALEMIGPLADRVTPVFISVDPERDDPKTLHDFVRMFDPRLVGLTGSADEVAATARAYRAYYEKAETGNGGDYLIDHSALTYLMGPDGKFVTSFSYGTPAEKMAAGLRKFLAKGASQTSQPDKQAEIDR